MGNTERLRKKEITSAINYAIFPSHFWKIVKIKREIGILLIEFFLNSSKAIFEISFWKSAMMKMSMTLYWGKELTLLLDSWKTESWPSYSLTLLFCFLLSLFHQRLEAQLYKLKSIKTPLSPPPPPQPSQPSSSEITASPIDAPSSYSPKPVPDLWNRMASAALFGFTSAIGYVIMLTIMTYNGGVFVAVVLGMSTGYFLFRSKNLMEDNLYIGLPTLES